MKSERRVSGDVGSCPFFSCGVGDLGLFCCFHVCVCEVVGGAAPQRSGYLFFPY